MKQLLSIFFLTLLLASLLSCEGEEREREKMGRPETARFLKGPTVHEVKAISDSLCRLLAAEEIDVQVLDSLIEAGADPDCDCLRSRYYRKFADRIPIIRRFVRRKYREVRVYEHPLHLAAISGHEAGIRHLIKAGANPNLRNSMEEHSLEWAMKAKSMPAIRALLQGGAKASEANLAYGNEIAIIDTLMAHGALGKSIRLDPYLRKRDKETVIRLIGYGADLDQVDGGKLLNFPDVEVLELCLAKGMSPDQPDIFKEPMIFETIRKNHQLALDVLIEADVDVNLASRRGKTPLMYATSMNRVEIMEALLAAGANLNAFDEHGHTPLHYALRSWGAAPLKLLLEKGANWPEDEGSMLDFAREIKARPPIVEFLESQREQRSFQGT